MKKELSFLSQHLKDILSNAYYDRFKFSMFKDDQLLDQNNMPYCTPLFPKEKTVFDREILIDEIINQKSKEISRLKEIISKET